MKDFFERQDRARRKTGLLLVLFFLAVTLIIISVYTVVTGAIALTVGFDVRGTGIVSSMEGGAVEFWEPGRFVFIMIITLLVVSIGTLYKISELRGGGRRVAEMLGGHPVERNTADLAEKRFLNVVEEMAIASGLPVPDVYVLDREGGINAFAAGFGIDDAVVCVTKGALSLLSRDELQGVVAHEFSHILNSDVSINIRLMGWLHGILVISLIGEGILRSTKYSRGRIHPVLALFAVALYVLGYIGLFFGKVIKSAVSRQREYLADASAVQFTRNPSGIGGALKKIGGLTYGSLLAHPKAGEASHMYISHGLSASMFSFLDTHPPLVERIQRIDPYFDGVFPKVVAPPVIEPSTLPPAMPKPKPGEQMPEFFTGAALLAMLNTAGKPMQEHQAMARQMIEEIPEPVFRAAHEPASACALIYLLLLGTDEGFRTMRLDLLKEFEAAEIVEETRQLVEYLPALKPLARLPLIDLSMPSLRRLSEQQYRTFRENVNRLIIADNKLSLFEYVLRYVLIRRLDAHFKKPQKKIAQIYSVRGVVHECSVVLSVFAHVGHRTADEAAAAFGHGKKILQAQRIDPQLLSTKECTLKELDRVLRKLSVTSPKVKRVLLAACLQCLTYDKSININEVELFRAVTEALGCPVPPWLVSFGMMDTQGTS